LLKRLDTTCIALIAPVFALAQAGAATVVSGAAAEAPETQGLQTNSKPTDPTANNVITCNKNIMKQFDYEFKYAYVVFTCFYNAHTGHVRLQLQTKSQWLKITI